MLGLTLDNGSISVAGGTGTAAINVAGGEATVNGGSIIVTGGELHNSEGWAVTVHESYAACLSGSYAGTVGAASGSTYHAFVEVDRTDIPASRLGGSEGATVVLGLSPNGAVTTRWDSANDVALLVVSGNFAAGGASTDINLAWGDLS